MLVVLREADLLGQVADLAVDPRPDEPLLRELLEQLLVLALAAPDDRCEDLEPRPLRELEDLVDDLLRRLASDRPSALRAVGVADPRVQHPEVVVDLGDRPDRRTGILRRRLLVDRDRRREPLDEVDVRLLHLPEELARVRRERLDVPPLALRVDRVERERGLPGPGQAGEHDERVPGELERDVPQVVLPGAVNHKRVGSHPGHRTEASDMGSRLPTRDRRAGRVRSMGGPEPAVDRVPFRDALRFWVKLGFVNFGGPTGQIALMHTELVERRRWLGESSFLHALNFAMLLPGPEAHQLAIYAGWLLNGTAGALVAGIFFLLPAFFLMVALSWIYAVHGDVGWVSGVFDGLAWAVVGIVAAALLRIGRGRSTTRSRCSSPRWRSSRCWCSAFRSRSSCWGRASSVGSRAEPSDPVPTSSTGRPCPSGSTRPWRGPRGRSSSGSPCWLIPLALVVLAAGTDSVLAEEAVFFSVMALVTFGGAYAVLAYVNQAAVLRFGWLTSSEMAVGLSLAETTPGPLILVVVFVGFVAAFRDPGSLPAAAAGLAGAIVTAWATFVPSFLFIFLGAPSVERLRGNTRLAGALGAITAAVVGVIANLALVFATSVLFDEVDVATPFGHDVPVPVLDSVDPLAAAVAVASFVAIRRFRVNVVWVVLAAGLVGLLRAVLG